MSRLRRARFLVEILQEIRRRVGDDFAVWCRLNSTENRPDGTTLDATLVGQDQFQDIAVLQAIVVFSATAFVLINLTVDLLYPVFDPRLRARQGALA